MPLNTQSKPKDAQASNTVGEGDDTRTFAVADPKGDWFVSKGQYPLIDSENGTRFEAGTPTRAIKSRWVEQQLTVGALVAVDAPEDAKGKAATVVDPAVSSEKPPADAGSPGPGMQSGVAAGS